MHFVLRWGLVCSCLLVATCMLAIDSARLLPEGYVDPRATTVRTLYQGSEFQPYSTQAAWELRAKALRLQVAMAAGLYPMPERRPLNAVVHGKIERNGYTIEKVFFESYPGFYVSGNLYRPTGKIGPLPAIISPHGHWKNGRLYDAGDVEAKKQFAGGWETTEAGAHFPIQARCANLAKLGCIVFQYDMVGYADSDPARFPHRTTYLDADSSQRLISIFGLQCWDSIRAMDFVLSLPDADAQRTGCTGASGGATQTIMMMALDPRLKYAAPVCMISAGNHQGGCVCENAALLRVGTDNVELAATFAPKPFIHPTATGDWTAHFMEEGFPQLKATYKLYDAEENVQAVRYQANHNYNQKNREAVYNFFNKQFKLGHAEPVVEQPFMPVPPAELSVFDTEHPRPASAVDAEKLKQYLIDSAAKQLTEPDDAASMARQQKMLHTALHVMLATELPAADSASAKSLGKQQPSWGTAEKLILSRGNSAEQIPALLLTAGNPVNGIAVVVTGSGKAGVLQPDGTPNLMTGMLMTNGRAVLALDVFMTGELAGTPIVEKVDGKPVEYRAGYNRTIVGNRVQDILTAVAYAHSLPAGKTVDLVGTDTATPWCLLARAIGGTAIHRLAVEATAFEFDQVKTVGDENYLPGSLRYGGLWPLSGANSAHNILVFGADPVRSSRIPHAAQVQPVTDPKAIVEWLKQ